MTLSHAADVNQSSSNMTYKKHNLERSIQWAVACVQSSDTETPVASRALKCLLTFVKKYPKLGWKLTGSSTFLESLCFHVLRVSPRSTCDEYVLLSLRLLAYCIKSANSFNVISFRGKWSEYLMSFASKATVDHRYYDVYIINNLIHVLCECVRLYRSMPCTDVRGGEAKQLHEIDSLSVQALLCIHPLLDAMLVGRRYEHLRMVLDLLTTWCLEQSSSAFDVREDTGPWRKERNLSVKPWCGGTILQKYTPWLMLLLHVCNGNFSSFIINFWLICP